MRLLRIRDPFDHRDFLFEPKIDGFRALAHVTGHRCQLASRNGHVFKSWPQLAEEIAHAIRAPHAILDGEICCLEPDGRSNFNNLLFRREWPYFYAFDLLSIDGKDVRGLPLLERKRRLRAIMPKVESRLLYVDHIAERGRDLFRAACDRDIEGIVAKWAHGTYQTDSRRTSWLKIKNAEYTQMRDRHELFESRGHRHHSRKPVARRPASERAGDLGGN
jgi:bifunctional non-homologous end joining protein LigD